MEVCTEVGFGYTINAPIVVKNNIINSRYGKETIIRAYKIINSGKN